MPIPRVALHRTQPATLALSTNAISFGALSAFGSTATGTFGSGQAAAGGGLFGGSSSGGFGGTGGMRQLAPPLETSSPNLFASRRHHSRDASMNSQRIANPISSLQAASARHLAPSVLLNRLSALLPRAAVSSEHPLPPRAPPASVEEASEQRRRPRPLSAAAAVASSNPREAPSALRPPPLVEPRYSGVEVEASEALLPRRAPLAPPRIRG